MAAFTINVTQDNIDAGQPCKGNSCPVALALHDATGLSWYAGDQNLYHENRYGRRVTTPKVVREFIEAFDDIRDVRPFSFTLEIPWEL